MIHVTRAPSASYAVARRTLDVLVASIVLGLSLPLLGVLALLVRLDSPGPLLFRQGRIGRGGRPFEMLKLRTMVAEADPEVHRAHVRRLIAPGGGSWVALADDDRVTRVGRLLRAAHLDELPQLVNVLRGEMALVGPRPSPPYEVDLWSPWHHGRLAVLPGITGLWQVEGRGRVGFDDMVRQDLDYIARRSIALDLAILVRTAATLLGAGRPA